VLFAVLAFTKAITALPALLAQPPVQLAPAKPSALAAKQDIL
jgi:hypothetical protein